MATYPKMGIGYDTTFELNEFNEPRLRSEVELIKDVILFVLFAKPGQYPSLPNIGIDIRSMLYSFYEDINESDLAYKITEQCNAMGVFLNNGTIQIRKTKYRNQPSLLISINGQESYPSGYMRDHIGVTDQYLIGITFDELNNMIYSVNNGGV